MAMDKQGLTKLQEECAELITIAAKKSSYIHTDIHPDSDIPMSTRLEEEMGDVLAAINFVIKKFGLSEANIGTRAIKKFELYQEWDKES